MKHRVDSPQGKEIYSHRMSVVEPVFGNIGTNKGLNRFSLRGRKRYRANGSYTAWCTILRSWRITVSWWRDEGPGGPKVWPLDLRHTGAENTKGLQLMAKHWNRDNRPADGHHKNFRNRVVGTAWNRVFLQPYYE
jgi:hypothetical protein